MMPVIFGVGVVKVGQIEFGESEAIGEGVEGEPQATLGGRPGSPRTGQWCRFCGSTDYPASDSCISCSMRRLSTSMEVSGQITGQINQIRSALGIPLGQAAKRMTIAVNQVAAALPSVVEAPYSPQSHGQATPT